MKKFFSLLLLALPMAFINTSCSDDDDLPDVDITLTVSNCQKVGNEIYVVQGDAMKIDAINVVNKEEGKAAAITSASYYWDQVYLGTSIVSPFGFEIQTVKAEGENPGTPLGRHLLQIESPLLAVVKEIATCVLVYTVNVVASADDIPEGGVTTFTDTPAMKSGGSDTAK